MISVSEAEQRVLKAFASFSPVQTSVRIPTHLALGRELMESVLLQRDHPPYDRVAMDGLAVQLSETTQAPRSEYRIVRTQGAGETPSQISSSEEAVFVATGAVLPVGANCVLPLEYFQFAGEQATLKKQYCHLASSLKTNIHYRAEDGRSGDEVLKSGQVLKVPDIALAATNGLNQLLVRALPRVAIVATGNEVVSGSSIPNQVQVYSSNSIALQALLHNFFSLESKIYRLPDQKELLFDSLQEIFNSSDVVLLSGGISTGPYDHIAAVLRDLKVNTVFHGVKLKPGKPIYFGVSSEGRPVFALPGNPNACLTCFRRFVVPALAQQFGKTETPIFGKLLDPPKVSGEKTVFIPVKKQSAENSCGSLTFIAQKNNGSGDVVGFSHTDGFVEWPSQADQVRFFSWAVI